MHEDSPAPFIVFRTPRGQQAPRVAPYQRALELVGVVHDIVQTAGTRFYLRDRLDRATTGLVFSLGEATHAPTAKWKSFRAARVHATTVSTVLDILEHQQAVKIELLTRARALVSELLADISPLCNG